jgi:hypothetical protein
MATSGPTSQVVAAESDADAFAKWDWSGISIQTYTAAFNQSEWRRQARQARYKDPVQGGLEGVRMWGQQCDLLLSDKPLLSRLTVRLLLPGVAQPSSV